jgi:hypothetical protein
MNTSLKKTYLKWTLWTGVGLIVLACVTAWFKLASLWVAGFQPPEMAAAQYSSKDVVGNLGGLPVRLPRYAVHLVEYDGEPSWGKNTKPVAKTESTGIKSFGFYARYPDMQMIDSYATEKEKRSQSIYTTMWLDVGVTSGEIYPKDGFLDRVFACLIRATAPSTCGGDQIYWWEDYERLHKPEHGLTVYALKGLEPKSGQPAREQKNTDDVFVAKDKQGRVRTYISCSNVGHEAAPCGHSFSMEYDGMHADISVKYRRGLLPHWQDIQAKVTQAMLGFVVQAKADSDIPKDQAASPLR